MRFIGDISYIQRAFTALLLLRTVARSLARSLVAKLISRVR